jgi:hypothetical protein
VKEVGHSARSSGWRDQRLKPKVIDDQEAGADAAVAAGSPTQANSATRPGLLPTDVESVIVSVLGGLRPRCRATASSSMSGSTE